MSPEEIKATVRRVIDEAFNKANLSALDEIFAPDMADRSTAVSAGQTGLEVSNNASSGIVRVFPTFISTLKTW